MESRGGKILEFLRENSHLDLEVPDIAFNVKKSEKTVEAALKKFQQKGLVTARQNEYGRVYWYALPSAPITKTFKLEDLQASKENKAAAASPSADDEVDLSDLTSLNAADEPEEKKPAKPGKSRKKTSKTKKKPAPKKEEVVMSASDNGKKDVPPAAEKAGEEFNLEDAADFETVSTPVEAESDPEPEHDAAPVSEPVKNAADGFSVIPEGSKAPAPTLLAILVLGIISIGALIKGCGTSGKLHELEKAIPTNVVVKKDFEDSQVQQAAKVEELEKKLTAMTSRLESLQTKVDSIVTATPVKKVKKRVSRKRYKKR